MADAGDSIVATVLLILALIIGVGAIVFQMLLWLGIILLPIAGLLMVRGDLGANVYVGWSLVLLAPIVFIIPGFVPAMSIVLPVGAAVAIAMAGAVKFTGIW